ncbi:MAG: RsmB/NOP family class I SAM-dependent RNA methyltransferase [Acholeplasmatales bacterium]|nr:RsmB/NOP family class I SAM-dependent RNA methyltransferase [Acholeplasmatales bacterium]
MISKDEFIELLKNEYPNDFESIINGLNQKKKTTFRINNILGTKDEVISFLESNNINYEISNIYDNCFILNDDFNIFDTYLVKEGKIYIQSISSQIPPLVMDLDESYDILDMCAAPGGKTSLIADLTNNSKSIMAVESNKIRAEKLKYNLNLLNVKANVLVNDSSKLDSFFRFDTILLDSPCSGAGTINLCNEKDLNSFSKLLVKNSSIIQKKLLKKAIEILKPGHTMIYSTCSILKEENEEVIKTVLNDKVILEKINLNIDSNNLLPSKYKEVLTIKPSDTFEGFFIAKIKKIK